MDTLLVTLDRRTYLRRLRAYKDDVDEFRQLVLNALVFDTLADDGAAVREGTLEGHLVDALRISRSDIRTYVAGLVVPPAPFRASVIAVLRDHCLPRRPPRSSRPQGPTQIDLPLPEDDEE